MIIIIKCIVKNIVRKYADALKWVVGLWMIFILLFTFHEQEEISLLLTKGSIKNVLFPS